MDVDALRVFLEVAKLQSLTRTGEQMGMAKSRVSRQIQGLESELGVRLFHRTTRAVRLSSDGEALVPRARTMVRDADEIATLFRSGQRLRGRVRVDLPLTIARTRVLPSLPDFVERHPELELFVSTTDRFVDAVREGFDLVLRVGTPPDSGLIQRKLGELEMVNCAAPAYIERRGVPVGVDDLDRHRIIHYAVGTGTEPTFEWVHAGSERHCPMNASVTVNSTDAYRAACLAGLGIVQVPRIGVEEHLERGALVELLPDHRCAPMPIALLHPHGRRMPTRVRAVMDWISEVVRRHLDEHRENLSRLHARDAPTAPGSSDTTTLSARAEPSAGS